MPYEVVARFDEKNLAPGARGKRFNPSIIDFEGGYLFAYRDGWSGSCIHLVRLDAECRPIEKPRILPLNHRRANVGREDPRLFWHAGRPHISFIGVEGGPQMKGVVTHQLYARLSHDLRIEDTFFPAIHARRAWEKNHAYFEHDGTLFAIYTVDPWNWIMRVDGNATKFEHRTITPGPWSGGEQRGGAAPVRVGDEYWHFTHARRTSPTTGRPVYEAGLYTFDATPPFRPRRIIPSPIMIGTDTAQPAVDVNYADVVFPCGAVRDVRGLGFWMLSCGIHDRWSEIRAVRHDELESRLVKVVDVPKVRRRRWPVRTPVRRSTLTRRPSQI